MPKFHAPLCVTGCVFTFRVGTVLRFTDQVPFCVALTVFVVASIFTVGAFSTVVGVVRDAARTGQTAHRITRAETHVAFMASS
jgi:hypothetical protein